MDSPLLAVITEKGATVHTVEPGATVLEAVNTMNARGVGAVLVTSGGTPVGIFSERDVLRRVVAEARDPAKTTVAEVMTRDVIAVAPSISVADAMAIVTARRVRHLPVVEGGRLLGMVSAGDLTRWLSRGREVEIQELVNFITGAYPA